MAYVSALDSFLQGQQHVQQQGMQELGLLSKIAQLQRQQRMDAQAAEMRPLQMDLLRSQIAERRAKIPALQQQVQARGALSQEMAKLPEAEGLRQIMEAEAQGRPMSVDVQNPGKLQQLLMQSDPAAYVKGATTAMFREPKQPSAPVKVPDRNSPTGFRWETRENAVGAPAPGDEIQRLLAGIALARAQYDTGQTIQPPAGIPAPQPSPQPAAAPTLPVPTDAAVAPQPSAPAAPAGPQMPNFTGSPREVERARNKWLMDQSKPGAGGGASDAVVNAIVEGRMAVPTGFALRSPYWQDVIERVAKKDPNFDAGKYGARAAARRTFASGPEGRNVTALNTVIGHLGTLDEMSSALGNGDIRMVNAVQNRLATELGDPRVQNFDTAKQAVAEETMRVFRQVGASESEARAWGERITSSGSPQQLRGVISTLGTLLESRVEAIGRQYDRTVNEGGNPASVDPKNKRRLDELRGVAPAGTSSGIPTSNW